MRIAIIGRTEILYETALRLKQQGHEIALIITAKDAPEYTKTVADFQALAEGYKIPFICTPRILDALDIINKSSKSIDIGVSLNYISIIPQSFINLFPLGILNAHAGDLPRYRGNACLAWAILNGEKQIGLCIHKMIGDELDSGDIITRDYYPITFDTKVTEIYAWTSKQIPNLFLDALKHLELNANYFLERQSQDPKDVLRCYPRKPEDGRINWSKSNVEILRLINACNKPYAGAFCEFQSQKMIIWDAELASEENFLAIPGQITLIGNDFVDVATGDGKLRIKWIEINGQLISPNIICRSIRTRFS
jgi:methionyl-tRNA formyltransferase